MPGMRCERCLGYRLYSQSVVAVRSVGGRLTATIEREGTPARVHGPEPVGHWHVDCYEAARAEDDRLPDLASDRDRSSQPS